MIESDAADNAKNRSEVCSLNLDNLKNLEVVEVKSSQFSSSQRQSDSELYSENTFTSSQYFARNGNSNTMQQIDKKEISVNVKKPYLNMKSIGNNIVVFDRYRCRVIQEQPQLKTSALTQNKSNNQTSHPGKLTDDTMHDLGIIQNEQVNLDQSAHKLLHQLIEKGDILYVNVQQREQIIVLLQGKLQNQIENKTTQLIDPILHVYCLEAKTFIIQNYKSKQLESLLCGSNIGNSSQAHLSDSLFLDPREYKPKSNLALQLKLKFEQQLNKISKGVPKYKLLNQQKSNSSLARNFNHGNFFEILCWPSHDLNGTSDNNQALLALVSQRQGVLLIDNINSNPKNVKKNESSTMRYLIDTKTIPNHKLCAATIDRIYHEKSNNSSYFLAQSVNFEDTSDVQRAKRGDKLAVINQTFKLTQVYAKKSTSQPRRMISRKNEVIFQIDVSQSLFQTKIDSMAEDEGSPYVPEFFLQSFFSSLKTVFAVNFQKCFEVYLIDPRHSKNQINLRKMLDFELLTTSRNSQIYALSINQTENILVISMTNRNFMCFNSSGQHLKTLSNVLFYQPVASNKNSFINKLLGSSSFSSQPHETEPELLELPEICQVDLIKLDPLTSQGLFLFFYGKRVIQLLFRTEIVEKQAADQEWGLLNAQYAMQYRYPKIITRNMQIDVHDYLYLQPIQQMVNVLRDFQFILADINQLEAQNNLNLFKQVFLNQFNSMISLVEATDSSWIAGLLVLLQRDILARVAMKKQNTSPSNIIQLIRHGKNNRLKLTSDVIKQLNGIYTVFEGEKSTECYHDGLFIDRIADITQYPLSSGLFFIPIVKILATRLYRNEVNPNGMYSQPEVDFQRAQVVKVHKLIKSVQSLGIISHSADMSKLFFKFLDALNRKFYLKSLMSQRRQIGLYDTLRQLHHSQQSMQIEVEAEAMLILKELYGKPYVFLRREIKFHNPETFNFVPYGFAPTVATRCTLGRAISHFCNVNESLAAREFYFFVECFNQVFKNAYKQQKTSGGRTKTVSIVKVRLPSFMKVQSIWTAQKFCDFKKNNKTQSCYEFCSHDISFLYQRVKPGDTLQEMVQDLHLALVTYLGNVKGVVKILNYFCGKQCVNKETHCQNIQPTPNSSNDLQRILFACQLYSELLKSLCKQKSSVLLERELSVWLYLLKQVKTQRMTLKISLSCLHYLANTLNIFEPLQPLYIPFITILCKTITSCTKKDNITQDSEIQRTQNSPLGASSSEFLPKFINYLLQNANQISFEEFKNRKKGLQMPFKESEIKVLNFIFEAVAIVSSEEVCNLQIQVDKNRLTGTPDIHQGIIDCVRFEKWEDQMSQMIQKNEISSKAWDQAGYFKKLNLVKQSIWRFIIALWYIQCIYMQQNSKNTKKAEEWGFRRQVIQNFHKKYRSDKKMMELLTELILESQFKEFAEKVPNLLQFYLKHQGNNQLYTSNSESVANMIQVQYKKVFLEFKEIFNLDLNFSVILRDSASATMQNQPSNDKKLQPIKRQEQEWIMSAVEQYVNPSFFQTTASFQDNRSSLNASHQLLNRTVELSEPQPTQMTISEKVTEALQRKASEDVLQKMGASQQLLFNPQESKVSQNLQDKIKLLPELGPTTSSKMQRARDAQVQTSWEVLEFKELGSGLQRQGQRAKSAIVLRNPDDIPVDGPVDEVSLEDQKKRDVSQSRVRCDRGGQVLERVLWQHIKKYQYSFFFNLKLTAIMKGQFIDNDSRNEIKEQRNKSQQDQTASHRTSMITADRSAIAIDKLNDNTDRIETSQKEVSPSLNNPNRGRGSSPSHSNDLFTTQMTPFNDGNLATAGADEQDYYEDRLATYIMNTDKENLYDDEDLRQSHSYRQLNKKELDFQKIATSRFNGNRKMQNYTQDMRESAEADQEAIGIGRNANRNTLRQSRDEKMHTSRFGLNVSGLETLKNGLGIKPDKFDEQSESSQNFVPKKSEEPTWSKRRLSRVQKTGQFVTLRDKKEDKQKGLRRRQSDDKSKFRFLYPIEHLKELKKQKSPLRRSNSTSTILQLKEQGISHQTQIDIAKNLQQRNLVSLKNQYVTQKPVNQFKPLFNNFDTLFQSDFSQHVRRICDDKVSKKANIKNCLKNNYIVPDKNRNTQKKRISQNTKKGKEQPIMPQKGYTSQHQLLSPSEIHAMFMERNQVTAEKLLQKMKRRHHKVKLLDFKNLQNKMA